MKKKFLKRGKKGASSFRPNRAYVAESVDRYLKSGGRVNHIILDEKSYDNFVAYNESPTAVDEFLAGR